MVRKISSQQRREFHQEGFSQFQTDAKPQVEIMLFRYMIPLLWAFMLQQSRAQSEDSFFEYESTLGTIGVFDEVNGWPACSSTSPYVHHSYGWPVRRLSVWKDEDNIVAVEGATFAEDVFEIGVRPARGADESIEFSQGERLAGDARFSGNGIGTRLGFMTFQTSKGQTFTVGEEKTPYTKPTGDSFLMGFYGCADDEVDSLGFIMMKEIELVELVNVTYEWSFDASNPPVQRTVDTVRNRLSTESSAIVKYESKEGDSHTHTSTNSLSETTGITVTASFPSVNIGVEGSYSRTFASEATVTSDEYKETTVTKELSVTVPPCSAADVTIFHFEFTGSIPFQGLEKYTFKDGSTLMRPIDGGYKSVITSQADYDIKPVPLDSSECSGPTPPEPSAPPPTVVGPPNVPTPTAPAPALPSPSPLTPTVPAPPEGPLGFRGIYFNSAEAVYITTGCNNQDQSPQENDRNLRVAKAVPGKDGKGMRVWP